MTLNDIGEPKLPALGRLHALIVRGTAGAIVWGCAATEFTFRYTGPVKERDGVMSNDYLEALSYA